MPAHVRGKHLLIAGSDEFNVKARAEEIIRELAPSDSMNLETVNGYADSVEIAARQIHTAIEALQTLPFFADFKVIYFKDVNFLDDSVLGKSESVLEALAKLAEILEKLPASSAQLVISAGAVDKRRTFFKTFSKFGHVEFFEQADLARDIDSWLDEVERRVRDAGLKPGPMVIERLVELAGNDSRSLQSEIEKLKLYTHPSGDVDEAAVRAICSSNREMVIWDLCDAMTLGKSSEAVSLLKRLLAQGETEVGILIILENHIRLAALGRYLQETGRLHLRARGSYLNAELTGDADDLLPRNKKGEKPNLFRLSKIVQQTGKKDSHRWFRAVEILHTTHRQLFASGTDRPRLLERTILELCTA